MTSKISRSQETADGSSEGFTGVVSGVADGKNVAPTEASIGKGSAAFVNGILPLAAIASHGALSPNLPFR